MKSTRDLAGRLTCPTCQIEHEVGVYGIHGKNVRRLRNTLPQNV